MTRSIGAHLPLVVGVSLTMAAVLHARRQARFRSTWTSCGSMSRRSCLGTENGGPRVAVVPAYQGRVMTSTAGGAAQPSYGWINYAHIESGQTTPHINVYGGEERFWLGPEGGQFSIFFPPGGKFELADWQTPTVIDTDSFDVVGPQRHVGPLPPRRAAQELLGRRVSTSASIARSNCCRRLTRKNRSAASWATCGWSATARRIG